jgi:7-keto-8-aminopelargonate synthetase-like enzyme
MDDLERVLRSAPETAGKLIVTDGVFSMGGDIARLPEIVSLARRYGARVLVDDAHGLGVLGDGGARCAALTRRAPPLRAAGFKYKLFVSLAKILPARLSNWIVGLIYAR